MDEAELERELRESHEKLNQERNSAVHFRIAAVEAQARADRDAQAIVNKHLGDRIDGVRLVVDEVRTETTAHRSETAAGFRDARVGMYILGVLILFAIFLTVPGALPFAKALIH